MSTYPSGTTCFLGTKPLELRHALVKLAPKYSHAIKGLDIEDVEAVVPIHEDLEKVFRLLAMELAGFLRCLLKMVGAHAFPLLGGRPAPSIAATIFS